MVSQEELQQALDAYEVAGRCATQAAKTLGIPRSTFYGRLEKAQVQGLSTKNTNQVELFETQKLKQKIEVTSLKKRLDEVVKNNLRIELAQQLASKMADYKPRPPLWKTKPVRVEGIPTLMLSDLHWGEVVNLEGVNQYNVDIARKRLREVVNKSLGFIHSTCPDTTEMYLLLGGDMIGGGIHPDLEISNELSPIQQALDLFNHLTWATSRLLERGIKQLNVVGVYGNHGRTTQKSFFKNPHAFNFDWQVYMMLANHFREDARVNFIFPEGFDQHFLIYDTAYILTHGDRIGGGGPEVGGKAVREMWRAKGYKADYVVMGHFHEPRFVPGLIVNGTLKGPDEYAMGIRSNLCPASQNIWITHPAYGITIKQSITLS